MSKFCPKCGAENRDDIVFCTNCYNRFEDVNQGAGPNFQNPQYQNQQFQNPYTMQTNMQYYQKPKAPGKGFAIASLCLGVRSFSFAVSSLYYAFMICFFAVAAAANSDFPNRVLFMYFFEVGMFLFLSLICGVLGFIFSKVAESKGYINDISRAGKLVNAIGLIGCGIAIIIVIFVAMFSATMNYR